MDRYNENLNLGNLGSRLQLNTRRPVSDYDVQQAAQSSLGALGTNAVASNPYATQQPQGGSAWDNTQKYLGAVGNLQSQNSGGKKNGLQKVLGLVGLFK